MKMKYFCVTTVITLVFLLSGCAKETTTVMSLSDISGVYTGTGAYTKLETPEDKSWLGEKYEIKCKVEQQNNETVILEIIRKDEEEGNKYTGTFDEQNAIFISTPREGLKIEFKFIQKDNGIAGDGKFTYTEEETNKQDEITFEISK